jgi:transposase InsO family protein
MIFALIEKVKRALSIERLCMLFRVSPSSFYAWKNHVPSRREKEDQKLSVHMRAIFKQSRKSYGRIRMTHEMQEAGFDIGQYRVRRLMKLNNLIVKRKRKFKVTTDSAHNKPIAKNLLKQDFFAERPNQKWVGDISYIWTGEGWLYLAVIIDLFSRRVVGWAMSRRMKKELAMEALQMAINLRQPKPGLIHHSDRGSQYCSDDYLKLVKRAGMVPSMSGKGNCYDNAVAESFFKTLKSELVWRTSFQLRVEAKKEIEKFINGFYNPKRRLSANGLLSPMEFEAQAATT